MVHSRIFTLFAVSAVLYCGISASAQSEGYDVFIPIAKYIKQGNAEKLSAWFDENLEITIISGKNDASRNQARQIVKTFFDNYSPRDFEISHKAGQANAKYALGNLEAGGELFEVTIFVNLCSGTYRIQQFKIQKKD